ncbi:transposase [Aneurinibacillus tyrosinisolvens]|uniref:transposase n=1 Tax=Aneurinibacillus tyrosinisolvens TaxID=1443435 RepID=UPI0009E281B7|nr:transposase [Aneurinibacillus tyrosinisolvens]
MKHTYSLEFKSEVIKEALATRPFSLVARKYKVNAMTISRWVREYEKGNFNLQNITKG